METRDKAFTLYKKGMGFQSYKEIETERKFQFYGAFILLKC